MYFLVVYGTIYLVFKLNRILDISVQDLVAATMKLRVIDWGIVFDCIFCDTTVQ